MTLVCTEQMKIWSWLHSETRTISFSYCQLFYDCLLHYNRNVNNSGLDETDWSTTSHFSLATGYKSSITFQIGAFFVKGSSEQHSKQFLMLIEIWDVLQISCISNWTYGDGMYKSILFQHGKAYHRQGVSLTSFFHCQESYLIL